MAKEDATQNQLACKVVDLSDKKGQGREMLIKEVRILMDLNHVGSSCSGRGNFIDLYSPTSSIFIKSTLPLIECKHFTVYIFPC